MHRTTAAWYEHMGFPRGGANDAGFLMARDEEQYLYLLWRLAGLIVDPGDAVLRGHGNHSSSERERQYGNDNAFFRWARDAILERSGRLYEQDDVVEEWDAVIAAAVQKKTGVIALPRRDPSETLAMGARVQAQWGVRCPELARVHQYYPGEIAGIRRGGEAYDILYDGGELETDVRAALVQSAPKEHRTLWRTPQHGDAEGTALADTMDPQDKDTTRDHKDILLPPSEEVPSEIIADCRRLMSGASALYYHGYASATVRWLRMACAACPRCRVPAPPAEELAMGARVQAQWGVRCPELARVHQYYPGEIAGIRRGGEAYDILYDGGELETDVRAALIQSAPKEHRTLWRTLHRRDRSRGAEGRVLVSVLGPQNKDILLAAALFCREMRHGLASSAQMEADCPLQVRSAYLAESMGAADASVPKWVDLTAHDPAIAHMLSVQRRLVGFLKTGLGFLKASRTVL